MLDHESRREGIADTVLNKPERLTESEFSLMKKHVEIGSEMLSGMNESISGLVEGMATVDNGTVLKSGVLGNRILKMTKAQDTVVNHLEHVRMLCFIVKIKENRNRL